MASASVAAAVKAYLDANWSGLPLRYPNVGSASAPADASSFIQVEYPVATRIQESIGAPGFNRVRETGTIGFIIAAQRGDGIDAGGATADALAALFRNARFGGVLCWEPSPAVEDNRNQDGNYFRLSMTVEYWFDILA